MKNLQIIILSLLFIFILSFSSYTTAFYTPTVAQNHGVLNLSLVTNQSIALGGEYGFHPNLALIGSVNAPFTRFGLKYQVNREMAILGGIGSSNSQFIGLNGGTAISRSLYGIYELNFRFSGNNISFPYEVGLRYNLNHELDIRGGLTGQELFTKLPEIKVGVGYKF